MVIILKQNSNKIRNFLCLTLRLAESHFGTRRVGLTRQVQVVTRQVRSNSKPEFDFQLHNASIQQKPIKALIPLMGFGHKNILCAHTNPNAWI